MNFKSNKKRRRQQAEIDLTPLIDVVFLLLIFFLLTATFSRRSETAVNIELPSTSTSQEELENVEQLTVFVDSLGGFSLSLGQDTRPYTVETIEALRRELETFYATNPTLEISLRGDRDADYGVIMDVWLMSTEVGFTGINAIVREAIESDLD
jgi:biopolymer transport protein ExbD